MKKQNIYVEICKIYCFCYYCILLIYLIEYRKQKRSFGEKSFLSAIPADKKCIIRCGELSIYCDSKIHMGSPCRKMQRLLLFVFHSWINAFYISQV